MSGWASAESPLHAFSLPLSGEDAQSRSVGWLRWRAAFRELRSQLSGAARMALGAIDDLLRATVDPAGRVPSNQASDRCR